MTSPRFRWSGPRQARVLGAAGRGWRPPPRVGNVVGTARPDARQMPVDVFSTGNPFLVKPYLQLGDVPKLVAVRERARALAGAERPEGDVGGRRAAGTASVAARHRRPAAGSIGASDDAVPSLQRAADKTRTRRRVRVSSVEERAGRVRRQREGARAAANQPYRFVVTGDTGATPSRKTGSCIKSTARRRTSSESRATSCIPPGG